MRQYLQIDDHSRLAVSLSLNYGFILIFPAFGPIMKTLVTESQLASYGSLFLTVLGLGFYLLPKRLDIAYRSFNRWLGYLTVLSIALFPWIPAPLKMAVVFSMGYVCSRIATLWSHHVLTLAKRRDISRLFLSILFISYSMLYIFNGLIVFLPPQALAIAGAAILAYTLRYTDHFYSKEIPLPRKPVGLPPKLLLPIFIIYLVAGVTYTGVYPQIEQFQNIDRFYNVLPFLLALPFGFLLVSRKGHKALLLSGMSLLGIAFLMFVFPLGVGNYLTIQTLLQAGWAFVDLFVWIYGYHLARVYNFPFYLNYAVGTFLVSTAIGGFLFTAISRIVPPNMTFIALLPLLISFVFVSNVPDNLKNDMTISQTGLFEELTNRERQIAFLLLENKTNNAIAEELSISPNTLKKHCGKIYMKLQVKNKTDLIKTYKNRDA